MARKSGVLLHVTSLPNDEGVGTLGPEAHDFIERLARCGQSVWQMLPVHPTIVGDSPFQGPSVFAGNPNLVSIRALMESGDLAPDEYGEFVDGWRAFRDDQGGRSDSCVEYGFLWERKLGFDPSRAGYEATPLRRAHERFRREAHPARRDAFERFRARAGAWLSDYARFMALKESRGFEILWNEWGRRARLREPGYEAGIDADAVAFYEYVQFVFDEQVTALSEKARALGVELVGDLAIYPAYDSADVWANRGLFQLDGEGRMTASAAVPPDYFSETGQLWGNPLYDWPHEAKRDPIFAWWAGRVRREIEYFGRIRLDHFRGFESYGHVEPGAEDAGSAEWAPGPGKAVFDYVARELGGLPIIAEDLGIITDEVRRLRKAVGCPGMKVLVFADWERYDHVNDSKNEADLYLPHNAPGDANSVFYTGTHDNETLRQKIEDAMTERERAAILSYLGRSGEEGVNWRAIDLVSASAADLVIFPAQDILFLGAEARMNNPSEKSGWWRWRLSRGEHESFLGEAAPRLRAIAARHGRGRPDERA